MSIEVNNKTLKPFKQIYINNSVLGHIWSWGWRWHL